MRGITDDFKNQQQRAMGILTRSGRGKGKGNKDSDELLFKYPFEEQEHGSFSRIMGKLHVGLQPSVESESESEKSESESEKSENESEIVVIDNDKSCCEMILLDNKLESPSREELKVPSTSTTPTTSPPVTVAHPDPLQQNPKTTSRIKDIIEIRSSDRDRLAPGEFLNDSIIDLWLRFISSNNNNSTCHFFTSHFYTMLKGKGPESVRKWSTAKNLDVFSKRFVFVPVNESLHWSLAVVVNPGALVNGKENIENHSDTDNNNNYDNEEAGCIIFLDSLKAHRMATIARALNGWLNDQWSMKCEQQQQVSERSEAKRVSLDEDEKYIRATIKLTLFHSITFAARRRKNIHKRELSGFKPQDPLPEQLV